MIDDTACTYLEVEDDGPDEPEGELGVSVDDVLAADVDELDLLVAQEPQRRLHVLDGVEAHAAALSGLFEDIGGIRAWAWEKERIRQLIFGVSYVMYMQGASGGHVPWLG